MIFGPGQAVRARLSMPSCNYCYKHVSYEWHWQLSQYILISTLSCALQKLNHPHYRYLSTYGEISVDGLYSCFLQSIFLFLAFKKFVLSPEFVSVKIHRTICPEVFSYITLKFHPFDSHIIKIGNYSPIPSIGKLTGDNIDHDEATQTCAIMLLFNNPYHLG
jgi:hypothetical protein